MSVSADSSWRTDFLAGSTEQHVFFKSFKMAKKPEIASCVCSCTLIGMFLYLMAEIHWILWIFRSRTFPELPIFVFVAFCFLV